MYDVYLCKEKGLEGYVNLTLTEKVKILKLSETLLRTNLMHIWTN